MAGPIAGQRCTRILETADPHTWADNYLCVPPDSPYNFQWSSAGPVGGKECVQWIEPADPHTWNDNFLCNNPFPGPASTLKLGRHYTAQQGGDATVAIKEATSSLAQKGFDNTISRYRIDGNEVWGFYDQPNFKNLLFTAQGPIGWTRVDARFNDRVTSVQPLKSKSK